MPKVTILTGTGIQNTAIAPHAYRMALAAGLGAAIDTKFRRLQFTPDLLPADLIGTLIYDPKDQEFKTKKKNLIAKKKFDGMADCHRRDEATVGTRYGSRVQHRREGDLQLMLHRLQFQLLHR